MAQGRGLRCGADIGSTFTDVVLVDAATGQLHIFKRLTTPDDPTRAALEGIASVLRDQGLAPEAVSTVIHGTTLVTNTLISVWWNPRRLLARWQRRSSASSRGQSRVLLYRSGLRSDSLKSTSRRASWGLGPGSKSIVAWVSS